MADLENWLRHQRCSNISNIALLDTRDEVDEETQWAMRPWRESGFLTVLRSDADEWADRCQSSLAGRDCGWLVFLLAPHDVVHDAVGRPTASLPIIRFAAGKSSFEYPPRPLAVRASLRSVESAEEARTIILNHTCAASELVSPTTRSARVHRYLGGSGVTASGSWEADPSGRKSHHRCDAAGDAAGPFGLPSASAVDDAWISRAAHSLSAGDGISFLRGAIGRDAARALRDDLWNALPPHKRTTRVFANHMCQAHRGVPESPGNDAACEPLAPALMQLPAHASVLALARNLLGNGFRLHNSGLSLVTPPAGDTLSAADLSGHAPHQDQPINSMGVWGGRVPPPTHPLSLQAIWMLDDFTYDNGATYVLPRTHTRPHHIDAWAANRSVGVHAAADGRLPLRFATGHAGDVLFAFGSLWHGASTSAHGQAARLALLFEYAPAFVEPRDQYAPALIARHAMSEEHQRIFPTLDYASGSGGASTPADTGATRSVDVRSECSDALAAPLSVSTWHSLRRERAHCIGLSTRVQLAGSSIAIPIFGLGTGAPDDDANTISAALRQGYRLIDTGELYGNEEIVARGIAHSGVDPASILLSSKHGTWCEAPLPPEIAAAVPAEYRQHRLGGLYPTSRGTLGRGVCIGDADATRAAFHATLARLGVRKLGVYMLHWPLTHAAYELGDARHAAMRLSAWGALVELQRQGLVEAIGVSNFSPRQIAPLLKLGVPSVLQVELHLLLQRPELQAFCEANGILLQSYGHHRPELGEHGLLSQVSRALPLDGKPLPMGLMSMRWALESGVALIPRSRKLAYVADNLRVFDFALPAEALPVLAKADANASLYGLHELFVRDQVE